MSKKQFCWHAYHAGSLCQLVDIKARQEDIEHIKPEHELPTRRRLMKPVVGELPVGFVKACEKEEAAREAWEAAWETAWKAREAREALEAVWEAAWKAWKAAYKTHKAEIERLHAKECPDCPWDGKSIFPETEEE